jgi:hypothetical protein
LAYLSCASHPITTKALEAPHPEKQISHFCYRLSLLSARGVELCSLSADLHRGNAELARWVAAVVPDKQDMKLRIGKACDKQRLRVLIGWHKQG